MVPSKNFQLYIIERSVKYKTLKHGELGIIKLIKGGINDYE